jgi:3-oxoacyl-[acyl-carrier protein] reductase
LTHNNKTAIITGGSKGIGPFIVSALASSGYKVVFTYKNSKENADKICAETPSGVRAFPADVCRISDMKELIRYTKSVFGGFEVIVNNAGITCDKPLMTMQRKDWLSVLDANLTGAYNMTRSAIVTLMKQRKGSIINISSISGIVGMAGQTNYAASKAGVIGFTKALAKEVGRYSIRVNAIAPGFFDTDMVRMLKAKERITESIPLGRLGRPCEIADLVVFLASEKSRYITGQAIKIDGGLAI